jgi:hypothetical protein
VLRVDVLDAVQLRRIEATHRGFLYQHLFAAGCLLKGLGGKIDAIVVEQDEDLEIIAGGRHLYAQIKTRADALYESELETFFVRARELALVHANKTRPGRAEIWIITNGNVSSGLAARLAAEGIGIWSPHLISRDEPLLPPPHVDVTASFQWCAEAASGIELSRLSPQTLVWKLAAVVAYYSAGLELSHTIKTLQLADLFELFATQLHRFPEPPASYRAQEDEPVFESEARVMLMVAISGAGKTAWASYSALHSGAVIVYFDAAGLPDPAVPGALLREVIAQITARTRLSGRDMIQPGASGVDGLRAVDVLVRGASVRPTVVLDNVHTLRPETAKSVVAAMGSCRWVLLGQPSPNTAELETHLGIEAMTLNGWSVVTVATEFASAGAPIEPEIADRLRNITGGVPRFVVNAAVLSARFYSGNARTFCETVEASANTTRTAQEVILRTTFAHLSQNAQLASALMSLARFPLSELECLELLSVHESLKSKARAAGAVIDLKDWGIVQRLLSGALVMHDAFLLVAGAVFEGFAPELQRAAMEMLAAVVEKGIAPGQVGRLMVYCRILPKIGRTDVLADVASSLSEHIHEHGRTGDLQMVLENVLTSADVSTMDRFMVADTLALWEFYRPGKSDFTRLLRLMEQLASETNLGPECRSRLAMKQVLEAASKHDIAGIKTLENTALEGAETPLVRRIVKYTAAVAFYVAEKPQETIDITKKLVEEYYEVLGLTRERVFARSPQLLAEELGSDVDTMDELKRLADVLDLMARALNHLGLESGLCRLHAMKFYQIAHAPVSLMKVGQDVVDEMLRLLKDPQEARRVIETLLLPIVSEYRLLEYVVPVRGQYAVVLAYCGEIQAARRLIRELEAFRVMGDRKAELEDQRLLIEKIARSQRAEIKMGEASKKVGRNDPCPCGSGKKYKKCHGC